MAKIKRPNIQLNRGAFVAPGVWRWYDLNGVVIEVTLVKSDMWYIQRRWVTLGPRSGPRYMTGDELHNTVYDRRCDTESAMGRAVEQLPPADVFRRHKFVGLLKCN
jgi:hypothetical protein